MIFLCRTDIVRITRTIRIIPHRSYNVKSVGRSLAPSCRMRLLGVKGGMFPCRLFTQLVIVSFISLIGVWTAPRALLEPYSVPQTDEVPSRIPSKRTHEDDRQCASPEYNVTWPLSGLTPSAASPLQCGTSSNSSLSIFFKKLATSLELDYRHECQEAVRFGVAFGPKHVKMLKPRRRKPYKCAVMFVLEHEMPQKTHKIKSFGLETLISIPRNILPYQSMRRNVKLIKLNGHVLFPWTKLLVWQDVKLKAIASPRPAAYYSKFLKPERYHKESPCLVAVGLPALYPAFGKASKKRKYIPKYQDHCDTVVSSIQERPTVTDSTQTLLQQCRSYQERNVQGTVSLDRGLIDSAFIAWNQDSEKCRDFNQNLACTWSDEVRCMSDRDQISFPHVLQRLGVRESNISITERGSYNSLYLVDKRDRLMVRILKRSCHWYFRNFPETCTA